MKQGPTEAFLLDQSQKQRTPIPKAILDAPELWPGSNFYYDAFLKLCSCRVNGMGMGRIPYGAVADYAVRRRMSRDETDVLWIIVSEMDSPYMDYCNKDQKNKFGSAKPTPNGLKSVKNTNG